MQKTFTNPEFAFTCPPELSQGKVGHYPVVIVGAGPVGLTMAIDLAVQGLDVLLLDNDNTVSVGSRGVAYAKRSLEIFDRLGCSGPMMEKGISWNVGRTFYREAEIFNFNLCPQPDHSRPGMINLQQYYLEDYLVRRAQQLPNLEMRFLSNVTEMVQQENGVTLTVDTPEGSYHLTSDWVVAADGARSPIRRMMDLDTDGRTFKDHFLIVDVVMKADYPTERWFWFDPPFHPGQSVLLHRQADNVWRIDFQLGWDADPEEEKKAENVLPRLKAMLGEREFELEWVSVYTFRCRRMDTFNHQRVLFVGDAAHQVSPFGGRGANSGIQDADNLAWKLKLVVDGHAPARLLDSYTEERRYAADENIMNSSRSTDFMTPKSRVSRTFRNAVLGLASEVPMGRALVNSGRLSVPTILEYSSLVTADSDEFLGMMVPGAPIDDAPIESAASDQWLIRAVGGRFQLLYATDDAGSLSAAMVSELQDLQTGVIPVEPVIVANSGIAPGGLRTLIDCKQRIAERYDLIPGTCYLIRPDQHVTARWRALDTALVRSAVARATCTYEGH